LLANLTILATLTIKKCGAILSFAWSTGVDIMSTLGLKFVQLPGYFIFRIALS
jgi:hypothetical protein